MKDWEKAGLEEVVCYCHTVTKGDIIDAIADGAETLEQVSASNNAGDGKDCATKNPSGKCCAVDIQAVLDIYVAAVKGVQEDCG